MTPRPTARPLLATLLAAVLLLGAAACSDDDEPEATDEGTDPTSTDDGAAGGDTPSVVAQGLAFEGDLTVGPGEEFLFDNQADTTHTLTADDGGFDSGEVPGGNQSDPLTAPEEAGDYAFHCEIHPSMTGTLTVEG
jgi:plastocyanin